MQHLPAKTGLPRLDRASWEKGFSDGLRGHVWWPGAGIEPLSYAAGYTEAQSKRASSPGRDGPAHPSPRYKTHPLLLSAFDDEAAELRELLAKRQQLLEGR
jgi:hypothetical protein